MILEQSREPVTATGIAYAGYDYRLNRTSLKETLALGASEALTRLVANRCWEVVTVEKGGNYGWNVREGTHGFKAKNAIEPAEDRPQTTPDDVRGGEPLLDPIIEYEHKKATKTVIDGSAVIGGFVYGTLSGETGRRSLRRKSSRWGVLATWV